jgi:hypothetical protein
LGDCDDFSGEVRRLLQLTVDLGYIEKEKFKELSGMAEGYSK